MFRTPITLALAAATVLAGCATSSPDVISRYDVQQMSTVIDATVLAVRPVTVDGSQSGAGAAVGGVVGAIAAGSAASYQNSGAAGLLGAVLGAMLGNAIERSGTREESLEIMVQLRNGERRAIVQAKGAETFSAGDPVIIVNTGGRARVTRAPTVLPQVSPTSMPMPVPGTRS